MLSFFTTQQTPAKADGLASEQSSKERKPWADGPYKLITIPSTYVDIKSHYALYMTNEMALVHNIFIRGFNAILHQGPNIPTISSDAYSSTLTHDFLVFVRSLLRALHHHHSAEEKVGFAAIEKEINKPGFLTAAVDQHAAFEAGIDKLEKHVEHHIVHPEDWSWDEMKRIIDDFVPALELHLHEEIDMFLSLKEFDEQGLKSAWAAIEKEAMESGGVAAFYDIFQIVFGCHDRTFPGGENFPPVPAPVKWACAYVFYGTYRGAWRFCPSDVWSNPRPLEFGGEGRSKA